ncbi:glutathione transferase [Alphaproteobacteria bacterium GH1-50]|uniref:Glutathione transferase n=1 Tax=Kangsaoukella pontilimi TaxID=2691042 RepID=A0A7C9IHX7_9RHOB|nr:VOC family protein [Kangsaoukella pontilimi]MXQ09304.1 glutathione transferase [Kangsaoukella pontilimi]
MTRVSGVNHVTLSVTDLDRSVAFYRDRLGARLRCLWPRGAYFELEQLWLCLEAADHVSVRGDDSHIAFSVGAQDFDAAVDRLGDAPVWKENRSEGRSHYFRDPDGHKLELHVGGIADRLAHYRQRTPEGMRFFD